MWQVEGVPTDPWPALEPVDVLDEFDGPRLFTCTSPCGELKLAYRCGETPDRLRFLLAPTTDEAVDGLRAGSVPLRSVFSAGIVRVLDADHRRRPNASWWVKPADLPQGCLPEAGAARRA